MITASDPTSTLADRIRASREAKGWTQADLAGIAGMSQSTISNFEMKLRKRPMMLHELAFALGKNPEWLLSGKGPEDNGAPPVAIGDAAPGSPKAVLAELARLIAPLDTDTRQLVATLMSDWVRDPATKTKAANALEVMLRLEPEVRGGE